MEVNNQKSGDSSLNLQAGRDNNLTVIVTSIESIVEAVKKSVLGEVSEEANKIAEQRVKEHLESFEKKVLKKPNSLINYSSNINTPDFQYIARKTILTTARTESEDLRKVLTGLLEGRLDSKGELKNIAYNQSIESIDRLTSDHLKIISLVFLLRYVLYKSVISWDTLNNHLNNCLSKFIDFKSTNSQFQYLNYTGHCRTSVMTWDTFGSIKTSYAYLFQEPILKEKIDSLSIKDKLTSVLVEKKNDKEEDGYLIRIMNEEGLREFLSKSFIKFDEGEGLQLVNLYKNSITKGVDLFIEKTGGQNGVGKKILDIVKNSKIENTELTLVGIITAITNIDMVCGETTPVDPWINN